MVTVAGILPRIIIVGYSYPTILNRLIILPISVYFHTF